MRIVVTGAQGMLGSEVVEILADDHQVRGIDIDDCDLSGAHTREFLISCQPDLLVHCAAYTNVDGCELDPQRAYRANAVATKHVAEACHAFDIPLIYISTDYVFDGKKGEPYTESDVPSPLNIYGRSKLEGEHFVRSLLERFYIIRTAWLYGRRGRNFVKTILEKARRGETLRVVADQIGSPTYTRDLAKAIARLVEGAPYGTYHLTNSSSCSWYQFAGKVLTLAGCKGDHLTSITSDDLGLPAPRPSYSVLAHDSWRKVMGNDLRKWQEALEEALATL